jgi:pimeloyl-ACP methyl ester carboxylesterase
MRLASLLFAAAALLAPAVGRAEAPPRLPSAIWAEPPRDPVHPASMLEVVIPSHGSMMNGIVYRPSGAGPFPLVVFIHGLPGNEQSLDLAQALRRAGWAVLAFHYRGNFGSEGTFSIDNVLADADAVIAHASDPVTAKAWNIDPARMVVIGHSLGGLAAAHAAAADPARLASVLIAPWDPSSLKETLRPMTPEQRDAAALARWSDVSHGRLAGTTVHAIAADIVDHGERWRLADAAPALGKRPLLIVTAAHDQPTSQAIGLKAALAGKPDADYLELDSDHSFNDHRIALEAVILDWLARLPGAPAPNR